MENDSLGSVQSVAPADNDYPVNTQSAPSENNQEKMVSQSQLESIVSGRLKDQERKLRSEFEGRSNSSSGQQAIPSINSPEYLDYIRKSAAEVAKKAAGEELQSQLKEQEKKLENDAYVREFERRSMEFGEKCKSVEHDYDDFHEVLDPKLFNDPSIVQVALACNEFENAGDMLYELLNNGVKLSSVQDKNPLIQQRELKRLSDSLKSNKNASNRSMPREPLSKVSSSNVPTSDNGTRGPEYFRNKFRC